MKELSLREIQNEELNILVDFDAFCSEHGLSYSLDGGTLLGAVRHEGFVPWDDDIDVCMSRPDYEKLLSLSHLLPDKYSIITMDNSIWPQPFLKIQNKEIRAQEPSLEGIMEEYLWIDVFPFDACILEKIEFERVFKGIRNEVEVAARLTYGPANDAGLIKKMIKRVLLNLPGSRRRVAVAKSRINEYLSRIDYSSSDMVFCYANQFEKMKLSKLRFEEKTMLNFEGRQFPCMSCWDECLKLHYGDYMVVPAEDQRIVHHMKAWRLSRSEVEERCS